MPRDRVGPKDLQEIAERLRLTRMALGYTQGFISRLVGSTTESGQAWENYESGRRRISINHAIALCLKCGLSLDWIYLGNLSSLHGNMAAKISEQISREQRGRDEKRTAATRVRSRQRP